MGCCQSRPRVGPQQQTITQPSNSVTGLQTTDCEHCIEDGHRKIASWWCRDCDNFLCNTCAWSHDNEGSTRGLNLVPASMVPKPAPPKPSRTHVVHSKHAHLVGNFDTRARTHYVDVVNFNEWNQTDLEEHDRGECLLPPLDCCCCRKRLVTESAALITGCVFVPGGYIAVTDYLNQEVKLFDSEMRFKCTAYKKLGHRPTDICCHGSTLFVTMEAESHIQTLGVSFPLSLPCFSFGRKLSLGKIIKTEGECDSVAVYKFSRFSNGLIVGMTFSPVYHTKRYQVHIISIDGQVKYKLFYDDLGQTLFWGKLFVSPTNILGEVIVSDKIGNHVRGFNVETGESLFNHYVREPLGVSVDHENNIYVVTNGCFYWIPPDRESVIPFLKRGHRSRSTNCCYSNKYKVLCVSSCHSETVQLYKLM